jgi:hypothetical protein
MEARVNAERVWAEPGMSASGAERKCWYGALPAAIEGNAENICSSRAFLWLTLTGHIATDLPAAAKAISAPQFNLQT